MTTDLIKSGQTMIAEPVIALEDRLEIIDEYVRKKYLTRLSDMHFIELHIWSIRKTNL